MKLKVALAQMRCEKGDWAGNLRRTEERMARAAAQGCDMAVFPEMGLSGYNDPAKYPDSVQALESPWLRDFARLTARHRIAASGGFIEANPAGKPFVTQVLAQNGEITGVYRKAQVVDEEAEWFSPGSEMPVFELGLSEGRLPCALAICADSDRPDLFAAFARKGARVVFHSSAPGLYGRRTDQASWQAGYDWYRGHLFDRLPLYAQDNHLWIAVATQTGSTVDEDFPGGSFIFSPTGECMAATDDWSEALLMHEIELPDSL
jgi:(R)-amidase